MKFSKGEEEQKDSINMIILFSRRIFYSSDSNVRNFMTHLADSIESWNKSKIK